MKFKRIKEKINDLEQNDRNDLLTNDGKELLKEPKLAINMCVCEIPEPLIKVSENGVSSYCRKCAKEFN